MRVRYTSTALAEAAEIASFISRDDPSAAKRLLAAIWESVSLISQFPEIAPVVHPDGVRAKMVARYRYRIFYTVRENEVIIRNVRSTSRRPPWAT